MKNFFHAKTMRSGGGRRCHLSETKLKANHHFKLLRPKHCRSHQGSYHQSQSLGVEFNFKMAKRALSEDFSAVKAALVRGRSSKVEVSNRLTADSLDTYSGLDDGYDSDCLSVDEYIDDFFGDINFMRKRVKSALPSTSAHHNKKQAPEKSKRVPFEFTDEESLDLERIRRHFKEVIDRHVLIVEPYTTAQLMAI